jgi:hypothetical protein
LPSIKKEVGSHNSWPRHMSHGNSGCGVWIGIRIDKVPFSLDELTFEFDLYIDLQYQNYKGPLLEHVECKLGMIY